MPVAEDSAVVAAAVAGNTESLGELFGRYEQKLYNYAFRLAGNREDALDISQEAFVKVFEALPKMADRGIDFAPYLYRTAHNVAIDTIRSRTRQASPEPLEFQPDESLDASPEKALLLGEQRSRIRDATLGLPENYREVLALRELQGLSYDQIGEALGMSRTNVGVTLMRARLKLKVAIRMSYVDVDALVKECADMLPLLSAMIDNELSADERKRVEAHLEECPLCRLALEQMTEATERYRGFIPLVPPPALKVGVLHRLGMQQVGATWSASANNLQVGGGTGAGGSDPSGQAALSAPSVPTAKPVAATAGLVIAAALIGALLGGGVTGLLIWRANALQDQRAATSIPITSAPAPSFVTTAATASLPATPSTQSLSLQRSKPTKPAPDTIAPSAPKALSPHDGATVPASDPNVTLRWSRVDDPSGVSYTLQTQQLLGGGAGWSNLTTIREIDGLSRELTVESTHIRWRVWAVDGEGNASSKTAWRTITRLEPTSEPTPPTLMLPIPYEPLVPRPAPAPQIDSVR